MAQVNTNTRGGDRDNRSPSAWVNTAIWLFVGVLVVVCSLIAIGQVNAILAEMDQREVRPVYRDMAIGFLVSTKNDETQPVAVRNAIETYLATTKPGAEFDRERFDQLVVRAGVSAVGARDLGGRLDQLKAEAEQQAVE